MAKYTDGFDYPAVHEQAGHVIKNRKRLKQSAISRYLDYYNMKCVKSKEKYTEACTLIPNGIQHNLALNYPFPLTMVKAVGAYLYDIDGNTYIDLLNAGGPTILGSNYPPIRDKVIELLNTRGPLTGLYSEYEYKLAKLINKYYPSVEMFRMMGSGTEADIIAIRLARAFTKKKYIIRINNNYHGWSDQLIYSADSIRNEADCINGIPAECAKYTVAVPVNNIEALEAQIKENMDKGGTAALIIEGIGQDSGAQPTTREFHKAIRKLCDKYEMLLIYDEVVTGFRLGMGGAQGFFGSRPDITVFGKIIGGCFPGAGGLGGRKDIMSMLAAGLQKNRANKVRVGGTLTANPLTCLAGITAIEELERTNAHEKLKAAGDELIKRLVDLAEKYDVPAVIFNQHSILHIDVTGMQHVTSFYDSPSDPECIKQVSEATDATYEFAMALAAEGVIVAGGNKTFLNLQSVDLVDDIAAAYERVFREFE